MQDTGERPLRNDLNSCPRPVAIIWTIGIIIVVVVGAILMLLGMAGHAVGGRRHYF